ncbi:MAG: tRNA 4-thiouridine(8) synthase ThiI [Clostridia bacterium]|nr:tRNA 4-thiouridine(8) synthase ThiI [Clostridia bacterium]
MKELILCKYGEVILKGLNKAHFEHILMAEVRRRLEGLGTYTTWWCQSTIYIEPETDDSDLDEAYRRMKLVFGFATVTRAIAVDKTPEAILEAAKNDLPDRLYGIRSFKVEGKRSDKRFPMSSPQLAAEVGGAILTAMPHLKVDLHKPDAVVRVEIREKYAFLHAGAEKGAGGLPAGGSGRALLLLSGGIDSPVAGYMIAKRGAVIEAIHFDSFPYTSDLAREKVMDLGRKLCAYTGRLKVNVISLTKIQEQLRRTVNEEYFTLLLRRSMMRLSERMAKARFCDALITGESLGQVASQTMQALGVTDCAVHMPIFRPCIGMDKEEIVQIARRIDTFETSILPYEDCCTVFTPKHPKTRPELEKVLIEEAKADLASLEDEAFAAAEQVTLHGYAEE